MICKMVLINCSNLLSKMLELYKLKGCVDDIFVLLFSKSPGEADLRKFNEELMTERKRVVDVTSRYLTFFSLSLDSKNEPNDIRFGQYKHRISPYSVTNSFEQFFLHKNLFQPM